MTCTLACSHLTYTAFHLTDTAIHLTDTAYGDIADHLVKVVKGSGGGDQEDVPQRRRLESIVTRLGTDPAQKPVTGWLLGGNQGGA